MHEVFAVRPAVGGHRHAVDLVVAWEHREAERRVEGDRSRVDRRGHGAHDGAPVGARQIVRLAVDRVQTSCGYGVPRFDYRGERPALENWAQAKGEDGLAAYRREKNAISIDGLPTGLDEPADSGS